jgi:glycosyltransferase involved in cell wall biosynthesis
MKPLVSVTFATFNRAHLLRRSVEAYNRLRFPLDRLEIIVLDDGSIDDTAAVCESFDDAIDVKYIRFRKPKGLWQDCAMTLNHGIRIASGEVIIASHPEVQPGRESIAECYKVAKDSDVWVSCKPYYLRPLDQENIDTVNWRDNGLLELRKLPGFYDICPGNVDYHPHSIDAVATPGYKIQSWESFVFAGMSRKMWSKFGGFRLTREWGKIDLEQHWRRHLLGIKCVTPTNPEAICVHQNHDVNVGVFEITNRDLDAAHANAPRLTRDQAGYPAVNEIGWGVIP